MVPLGDSLYLSTSAKGPNPYQPKFTFLSHDKLEYGTMHRFRKPGCLSVPIEWKNEPTTIEFKIAATGIELIQDGEQIGAVEWADEPGPADETECPLRQRRVWPFWRCQVGWDPTAPGISASVSRRMSHFSKLLHG